MTFDNSYRYRTGQVIPDDVPQPGENDTPRWTVEADSDGETYLHFGTRLAPSDYGDLAALPPDAHDALVALVCDHAAVTRERDALRAKNEKLQAIVDEWREFLAALDEDEDEPGGGDGIGDAARAAPGDTP